MNIGNNIRNIAQKAGIKDKSGHLRRLPVGILVGIAAVLAISAGVWASELFGGTCNYEMCQMCMVSGGDACLVRWCSGCTLCGFYNPSSPTITNMKVSGTNDTYAFSWTFTDKQSVWGSAPGQAEFIFKITDPATGKVVFTKDVVSASTSFSDKSLTLGNGILVAGKTYTWTLKVRDNENPYPDLMGDCTRWSDETSISFATCQRPFVTLDMNPCARADGICSAGEYVTFKAGVSHSTGTVHYSWTVNGSTVYTSDTTSQFTSQLFSSSVVGVSVRDDVEGAGCNSPSKTVSVDSSTGTTPASCSLVLNIKSSNIRIGETVMGTASGGNGSFPVAYKWYLDGAEHNVSNTMPWEYFTFNSSGHHTVRVEMRNDSTCAASKELTVIADPFNTCDANLYVDNSSIRSGNAVKIAAGTSGIKNVATGTYSQVASPVFNFTITDHGSGTVVGKWSASDLSASSPDFLSSGTSFAMPYSFSSTFPVTLAESANLLTPYDIGLTISQSGGVECSCTKTVSVIKRSPKWTETVPNLIPAS